MDSQATLGAIQQYSSCAFTCVPNDNMCIAIVIFWREDKPIVPIFVCFTQNNYLLNN